MTRRGAWRSEVCFLILETWDDEDLADGWQQRVRMCSRPRRHGPATGQPWEVRGAHMMQRVRRHQYGPVPLPFNHRRRRR